MYCINIWVILFVDALAVLFVETIIQKQPPLNWVKMSWMKLN